MKSFPMYLIPLLVLISACGTQQHEVRGAMQDTTGVTPGPAQPAPVSEEPKDQDELMPFLLAGHEILNVQKGDINNDQLEDVILIQHANNEAETSETADHPQPRPLMLLLRKLDGTLHLAGRNDQVVMCIDCGGMMGDPYQGIVIKGNYFSIENYGGSAWRWSRIITFKYRPDRQDWYLHKEGGLSYHTASSDSTMEESIKTVEDFGEVRFEEYQAEEAP